jgi:hypothetical protein
VKTVHIALAPISALVWGYEQIKEFVSTKVAEKLKGVPPECIVTPKPNVAGPALESLKYTGHEESLRDLYANLLAASMDSRTADGAHPAFVEIIRQLTPDEARLLSLFSVRRPFPILNVRYEYKNQSMRRGGQDILFHFSLLGEEAGCQLPQMTPSYISNICRLGLAEVPTFFEYTGAGVYDPLENHPTVLAAKEAIKSNEEWKVVVHRSGMRLTPLGKQFCNVCVVPHEQKVPPSPPDT